MRSASSPRYLMPDRIGAPTGNLGSAGRSLTYVLPMTVTPASSSRLNDLLAGMRCRAMKMAPTPEELEMMDRVKANVFSWLVIAGIGGVIFLSYTVPRQLDSIQQNQETLKTVVEQHARELMELRERTGQLERSFLGPRR
jgi:hypothetical protein